MRKVLVTGGAGFIGSNLCQLLVDRGNQVTCLDNLHTGTERNILGLLDNRNFRFVKQDITVPFDLPVDQVYNLACPASPLHYQLDPIRTIKACTIGLINVLDNADRYGSKVLQASTSEVYGDPIEHPQKEEYWGNVNPTGVRSCYNEGKRIAESLMFAYHRQMNADIRLARIFNTFGPRMRVDDGRVVSNFIVKALRGEDLIVYGDGEQTRSFCYVTDIVDGLQRLMEAPKIDGPVNLGNPEEHTILELAHMINDLIPGDHKIHFRALPEDDPCRRNPDITKAKTVLGWEPKVKLEDGLNITINYFRGQI